MSEEQTKDEDILAEEKFSVDKELDKIVDSLRESRTDILKLFKLCEDMKESFPKGTKEQLFAWDSLIKDFKFFEEDVDVNGERIKKITSALIEKAKRENIDKEKIEYFKKKESWSFDW